jgi:26S proteasome regulatory subunit T6
MCYSYYYHYHHFIKNQNFQAIYLIINIWFVKTIYFNISSYYVSKIEEAQIHIRDKKTNLERLTAQRNELNTKVRLMREELTMLHEPGSYVGEVVKAMGKSKVLVKVNPDGKYVVDLDKDIDINKCTPNTRVALKSDSYTLHKILPTKVDPLVSLMKVRYRSIRIKFDCL